MWSWPVDSTMHLSTLDELQDIALAKVPGGGHVSS